ncbi:MAG: hypothetical protein GQ564_02975 [Bacteroidales bacterium]|nr:hypothetical protein [Bacteroidales bacterium]
MIKNNLVLLLIVCTLVISIIPIIIHFETLEFDIVLYANEWIKTFVISIILTIILKYYFDNFEKKSKNSSLLVIIKGIRSEINELADVKNSSNNNCDRLLVWHSFLQEFMKNEFDIISPYTHFKLINTDNINRFSILYNASKTGEPFTNEEATELNQFIELFLKEITILINDLK